MVVEYLIFFKARQLLCEYISKSQQANHNLHGKCSAYLITIIVTVWGSTECIYLRITAAYYTRSFLANTLFFAVLCFAPQTVLHAYILAVIGSDDDV